MCFSVDNHDIFVDYLVDEMCINLQPVPFVVPIVVPIAVPNAVIL